MTETFARWGYLDDLLPEHLTRVLRDLVGDDDAVVSACDRDYEGNVSTAVIATRRCLVTVERPDDKQQVEFIPWSAVTEIRVVDTSVVVHSGERRTIVRAETPAESLRFAGLLAGYLPATVTR